MSSLFTFLLVVHAIVAASLVGVILMQRSEGGGLTGGGSPAGLMTARGAADFLTRATTILATLFVALSIGLAALAANARGSKELDTSLSKTAPASSPTVPLATTPVDAVNATGAIVPAKAPEAPVPLSVEKPKAAPTAKPAAQAAPKQAEVRRVETPKPAAPQSKPTAEPAAAPATEPTAPATGN
jgi:preprotein translocase subunit SecG